MTTTTAPAFSLCVYCGSSPGHDPALAATAADIGGWIGRHGGRLVYGGGRTGLMGVVADATLAAGGQVLGVIPRALVEREYAHTGCTDLRVVDTMHQRKRLMAENADAFVALPGGIGTLEELFETWTWRQLGYHNKPLGLLNQNGYYDALLAFIQHSLRSGFMSQHQLQLIEVAADWQPLLASLISAAGFPVPPQLGGI